MDRQPTPSSDVRTASARRAEALAASNDTADRGRLLEVLAIMEGFAMVGAALFVIALLWRRFVEHTFVPASLDIGWLAPISHAFVFGVIALPLLIAAPFLSRRMTIRLATWLGAFTLAFSLLLPWTQVGRVAALIFSAGVGVVLARDATKRPMRWPRLGRLVALAIAIPMLAFGGAVSAWRALQTRRAIAHLPPVAAADQPNVLFLVLDTVRGDALGTYGYARATTPNIDRLAQSGVVFDRASATAPWTLASHGSMFTGYYGGRLDLGFRFPYQGTEPTLAEGFRARGYETAGFIGNLHYVGWDSGLDRGFARWFDYRVTPLQILKSSYIGQSQIVNAVLRSRTSADVWKAIRRHELLVEPKPIPDQMRADALMDQLLAWHAARGTTATRPFFAFVNFYDAHVPYEPPERLRAKFAATPTDRDLYDAALLFIDEQVGRMLDSLAKRGAMRNTLVVLTADHGEQFGEHGMTGHGNTLYMPLLHVPLVMAQAGKLPAGARVTTSVSLRDLAATIADVTGLKATTKFPGQSLAPLWSARDSSAASLATSAELAELYTTKTDSATATAAGPVPRSRRTSLIDGEWHYLVKSQQRIEELYRLSSDPTELTNLAGDETFRATRDSLRARLTDVLRRDDAPPAMPATPLPRTTAARVATK